MSVVVTKKVDGSVPKSRWIASLSNGETIFEDHKDGLDPAWERLARYVEQEGVSITKLRAQFESGRRIDLPAGQEGYIQKKKAWFTGSSGGVMLCVGYASKGKCLIHEASNDGDSFSAIQPDPGPPWTIYKKEIRDEMAR